MSLMPSAGEQMQALKAEAERRQRNRAAGRAVTDDGEAARDVIEAGRGALGAMRMALPIAIPDTAPRRTPRQTLVVPWSAVAHDNHRLTPARGRLITSGKYRRAKAAARDEMAGQWDGPPLAGAVILDATAWFPDKRKRDAGNYRKLLTDALSGIAYGDDAQIVVETWRRGGIDRDNPRIELTLHGLTDTHQGGG